MAAELVRRSSFVLGGLFLRCLAASVSMVLQVGFAQSPLNDDFVNATPLHGDSVVFSGSLANATFGPEEYVGQCYEVPAIGSVWWRWTAEASTTVVIGPSPAGSTNATPAVVEVFQGTEETNLLHLDCTYLDSIPYRYISFESAAGTAYHVRVAGMSGEHTLRLVATNSPVVLASPADQTATEGSSAAFWVFAAGAKPLSYQWYFAGEMLTGQTKAVMLQHNLNIARTGEVYVVVSNAKGSTTSARASLTVRPLAPLPKLEVVGVSGATNFLLSLSGCPEYYLIESSTNLVEWFGEKSLFDYQLDGNAAVVPHFGDVTLVNVPMQSERKFVRVRHYLFDDICVAQLSGIDAAIKLHGIHSKLPARDAINYSQVRTNVEECKCPSRGNNLFDSYTITVIDAHPWCQQVPQLHLLTP